MKKLFLFLLGLFLCSMSMPLLAQDAELVPAMVVQMADGSKQVVQLDHTSVTDFSVLCSKGSLAVSVPEVKDFGQDRGPSREYRFGCRVDNLV